MTADMMEFCIDNVPKYHPLSISGYHIREAGSTAAQELAFTVASGFAHAELGIRHGLDIDEFAPGLSFFFNSHIDFFEEIAKFRAARRIWARWMKDRYGAKKERSWMLKFHTQTAGVLAHRAAAVQQRRAHRDRGSGGGAGRDASRCTRTRSTRCSRSRPTRPSRSRSARSR